MGKEVFLQRLHEHKYTQETIYHFTCGSCKNWWSYASTEEIPDEHEMFCPHCRHKAIIKLE